jgi:hypothetical protein
MKKSSKLPLASFLPIFANHDSFSPESKLLVGDEICIICRYNLSRSGFFLDGILVVQF